MDEDKINRQKILIRILAIAVILLLGVVVILFIKGRAEESITIKQQPPLGPTPVATNTPPPASSTPATALKSAHFTLPYPLTWMDGADEFDLTGVTLGEMDVTPDVVSASTGQPYQQGTKIYALTLILKISTGNSSMCLPLNMRRVISEAGDLAQPNTTTYDFPDVRGSGAKGYCPAPNSTFDGQKVVFEVPRTDTQFTLTTGGSSNIFFFVSVQNDGTLKVEKAPTSENG